MCWSLEAKDGVFSVYSFLMKHSLVEVNNSAALGVTETKYLRVGTVKRPSVVR